MDFRILGPLEVAEHGSEIPLGVGRERAVLAILLLHRNEVISVDRLIDDLWGDRPPATANKALQGYVSRLRKSLNGSVQLLTEGPGYVLRLENGQLDLDRFERLTAEGQDALRRGQAVEGAKAFEHALGLWRGPPLADFAYDEFAQAEIARLEEMRLAACEGRIEADLALGRHRELVPELEGLLGQHPLREHLRALLMLALYRTGRQADALDTYRRGRAALVEQLGIEPGEELKQLEQRILEQDPALEAEPGARLRAGRALPLLVAVSLAVLGVAIAAIVLITGHSTRAPPLSITGDSLVSLDPTTRRPTTVIALPNVGLASDRRSLWIDDGEADTASLLDRSGHALTNTFALPGSPSDMAVDGGALWVADGTRGLLTKVDSVYGVVRSRRFRPRSAPSYYENSSGPTSVAADRAGVWVTDGSPELVELDPGTLKVERRIRLAPSLDGVALGAGSVWAISGDPATVYRLNPATGAVRARVHIAAQRGPEAPYPLAVAYGAGYVWVLDGNTSDVVKIDPGAGRLLATTQLGVDRLPNRIAAGAGAVWTANGDGSVTRIDAVTGAVSRLTLPHEGEISAVDIGIGRGAVWLGVSAGEGG
jgi:DNA-binding SARP family transcriptional activator/streptogramin lyase